MADHEQWTAVHHACIDKGTPLDIVIQLVNLCSKETVNMRTDFGHTPLDLAVMCRNTTAALYLSWLEAECREENRKYREVNLNSWIDEGCQQEAQYWAVAANNIPALKLLERFKEIELDRARLRKLAKLLDHRAVWSWVTSLGSLAWEEVERCSPALTSLPPCCLLQREVPPHVVKVLISCSQATSSVCSDSSCSLRLAMKN